MAPTLKVSQVAQRAAFALYESFRHARDLRVTPGGRLEASCLRCCDPASQGLAWGGAQEGALQLQWRAAPFGLESLFHLCAATEGETCRLGLYLTRERAALECRLAPPSFIEVEPQIYLLRERVTFSSHDGRHQGRSALVRRLADQWAVPHEGAWLHMGRWDALESSWEPDVPRRFLAAALLLEAARKAGRHCIN